MILLKANQLRFEFPAIGETLQSLVEKHIEATMPRLLAEDRELAVDALESHWVFKGVSTADQQAAREKLRAATPQRIEEVLRDKCLERSRLRHGNTLDTVSISFQRTLRIPDDGKTYPLPASLGNFPLRQVDDFARTVPERWLKHGGVMMPMYQSEALWMDFEAAYPMALKVGAGKINAVTGEAWKPGLAADPQNYLVLPEQPWLDGFAVGKGVIRQFVAMPLGDGYSVEEQLTGRAESGGIQLEVFPMKPEAYYGKHLAASMPRRLEDLLFELAGPWKFEPRTGSYAPVQAPCSMMSVAEGEMGLGAGGTMQQEIYDDPNDFEDWDTAQSSRCFVHLCNSLVWRQITGKNPPHPPLTAKEYRNAHIPWFDYYRDDLKAVTGSKLLAGVKSVLQMGKAKGAAPLPENASIEPELIVQYGNTRRPDEVREWVGGASD